MTCGLGVDVTYLPRGSLWHLLLPQSPPSTTDCLRRELQDSCFRVVLTPQNAVGLQACICSRRLPPLCPFPGALVPSAPCTHEGWPSSFLLLLLTFPDGVSKDT